MVWRSWSLCALVMDDPVNGCDCRVPGRTAAPVAGHPGTHVHCPLHLLAVMNVKLIKAH